MKQIWFDKLESTQTTARQLLQTEKMPYVVIAHHQTQGHGKYGRRWFSERGNFAATFVLDLYGDNVIQKLPMWLGLKIIECLLGITGKRLNLKLKWPNDILLNTRKMGGILIERLEKGYLIGIGLNLAHAPKNQDMPYAVGSLLEEETVVVSPEAMLMALIDRLSEAKSTLSQLELGTLRNAYLDVLYGLGKMVQVKSRRQIFKGILKDIQWDGAAIVSVGDKDEKIYAADIFI